jgi:ABC-type amino acid transport system permease subunit
MEDKNAREEYAKGGAISDKLIRKITLWAWTFALGLLSLAIALSFGILFAIFSLSSLIFLASVVFWSVWYLRSPEAEKNIFASLYGAVSKNLSKGVFGHVVIIGGFLVNMDKKGVGS